MIYEETEPFWNGQLQNSVLIPDFEIWEDRYRTLSEAAKRLGETERIATGPDPSQSLWRTRTGRASHGLIFIHGGYWRRFAAADFHFVAEAAAAANATFYNVDYRLMPAVSMEELVADTAAACGAAMEEVEVAVIVGHSAGGHLAVQMALDLERPPTAAVSISGLFDLEPLRHAFIQRELDLTNDDVARYSPLPRAGALKCPVHLSAGAEESVEFRRQSAVMFEAIRGAGGSAELAFVGGTHHSSVVAALADPSSPMTQGLVRMLA
ncbi:MAG: alpha/beta hydrolase [Devosia sp.]